VAGDRNEHGGAEGVAVAGWQWYGWIGEIGAVRMVVVAMW
jgi:hypothetical protein